MQKIIAFTLCLSFLACADRATEKLSVKSVPDAVTGSSPSAGSNSQKSELTKIYTQSIRDYIQAVYNNDKIVFDTLYFGKRAYGQEDDFPDITLPEKIENTNIRLVDPEPGLKMQRERKSLVYINMMGWVEPETAEFILVNFSNGAEHKFDCHMNYTFNVERKSYDLTKLRLEYFNRQGKVERVCRLIDGKFVQDK